MQFEQIILKLFLLFESQNSKCCSSLHVRPVVVACVIWCSKVAKLRMKLKSPDEAHAPSADDAPPISPILFTMHCGIY